MIDYNRNNWWSICFAWRGTVLPHVLGRVGMLTGFALALFLANVFILDHWLGIRITEGLDALGHTVMGVALSMLIVFRTQSSNGRFWEARSHWGMIVNTTRNLARGCAHYAGPAEEPTRLIAAWVVLVREQLRGNRDINLVRHLLTGRIVAAIEKANNPATALTGFMSEWVAMRLAEKRIDPMMAAHLEGLISTLVDAQGACEKINKTPLPFVYAALIKQVLLLYLVSLPLVLVPKMGFMAPLVVAGVSLGMLGIEEAGVEIENPFGLDLNHLPLEQICAMIGKDAADLGIADREALP
jgi:putative membrane protein